MHGSIGSWTCAVTTADGTWMTRSFHSKNATFSICNYFSGALLYCKHLCQSGRDKVVKEELYKNTSKGAEGYATWLIFKKAKEGMDIAVQWQDADSSSNVVTDIFPEAKAKAKAKTKAKAKVMICGGHAGRAHKKQLEKLSKIKPFSPTLVNKYSERFPFVGIVVYHCSRHYSGCGCLSDNFIERARNNFFHSVPQPVS